LVGRGALEASVPVVAAWTNGMLEQIRGPADLQHLSQRQLRDPAGRDPAYRPTLDKHHNGIACESREPG